MAESDGKRELIDQYTAATNLTDEQKKLAQEVGQFYEDQFAEALEAKMSSQMPTDAKGISRRQVELVASVIGTSFSPSQFNTVFKDAVLCDGWTTDDALAAWCSLGNLALVITAWTTWDDEARAVPFIHRCRTLLLKQWGLAGGVLARLQQVVAETEASAFTAFTGSKDGIALMGFFSRYVSRILGAPVPFSSGSRFEDDMMGIKYRDDMPLEVQVCGRFVETCTKAKNVIRDTPLS